MAIITPNAGLVLTYVIVAIFSMWMLVNPIGMLEMYKIDFTNSTYTSTDKMLVSGTVQLIALNFAVAAGALTITYRNGTDDQKSMLCFMTGLWSVVQIICNFCSIPHFGAIGVPASGAYFNVGLLFVVGAVNFLGADCPPKISMAPVRKPLYWGYIVSIVVTGVFTLLMFFIPDKLMNGYGVQLTGNAFTVCVGLLRFTLAPWYLYMIFVYLAQLLVMGPCATYGYSRWMSCSMNALAGVSAILAVVWQCLNDEEGKYDKLIKGQYFNMVLYFVFFLLFYIPVAQLDPVVVKDTVEKEIGKDEDLEYEADEFDDDDEDES